MAEVEFLGETFTLADKVGLMPLMRFAALAKRGMGTTDLEGLAVLYDLVEQCVAESEWERFQAHATTKHADADDLLEHFVPKAIEAISQRPTERPSGSSDGLSSTAGGSTGDSFSQVKHRLESEGRPDLALMVVRAQESRAS